MCYDIIYDICSFAAADPAPAQRAEDSDADLDGPMDDDEARDFADQDPPSAMDMEVVLGCASSQASTLGCSSRSAKCCMCRR